MSIIIALEIIDYTSKFYITKDMHDLIDLSIL